MTVIDEQLEIFKRNTAPGRPSLEAEWGTFKDSLRAPVHRWFTYPAGYSFRAVEFAFKAHGIGRGMTVYDPFMGTGTTNVVAKSFGINSQGVEAHPFVFTVAKTKMDFEIPLGKLTRVLDEIERNVRKALATQSSGTSEPLSNELPELVVKCYNAKTLRSLVLIRDEIRQPNVPTRLRDFLNVALTSVLRQVASVHTGWPYIAPNKCKVTSEYKDALKTFVEQVHLMAHDIEIMRNRTSGHKSTHAILEGDARDTTEFFDDGSADFVITSPPYLNNYDYADRTRLEMYFFGQAKSWGDISENVRTKLITSATTQIARTDERYRLSTEIADACPHVHTFLVSAVEELGARRLQKGGKKSYDLMVAGYFNDMFLVIRDVVRILKPGGHALFILGDSAPYGVHIATDELIGEIGVALGFKQYSITQLRTRGGKWAKNPQRHTVALREAIVTLER